MGVAPLLFVVPRGPGAGTIERSRLEDAGLVAERFEWADTASGALTQRLSTQHFSHLAFVGFDDERLQALDRATANWRTPVTVLLAGGPLAAPVAARLTRDERFVVVNVPGAEVRAGSDELAPFIRALLRDWEHAPSTRREPCLLTIAVPAFNAGTLLTRSVESVLAARLAGVEVLVVDDGSTDTTPALADELAARNPSVRVIHQANRGHGGAINAALANAQGLFFRVLDADDRLDPVSLDALVSTLDTEVADVVLTDYMEDRPEFLVPRRIAILDRLPPNGLSSLEQLTHPVRGVTSWAVLLATSTFRTEQLRRAGVRLTENSPYVDLEFVVLGLEHVETLRYRPLNLYRYTLGAESQSVSEASYLRNLDKHEAVLLRLCRTVAERPQWGEGKRRYVVERVIEPIARRHLELVELTADATRGLSAFRRRMSNYPFVRLPPVAPRWKRRTKALVKRVLPPWALAVLRRLRG